MTRLLLALSLLLAGGCNSSVCREEQLITANINGGSRCSSPQARIEVTQYQVICRCPPFAPVASGSAKP